MTITSPSHKTSRQKPQPQAVWAPPRINARDLSFTFGASILEEFILSHSPDDVLRELVQNEYDAGGSRLEVLFDEDRLQVTGNGRLIDAQGWKRLSVMLGTGSVVGSDRSVEPKVNGIGSKNFGLRSLFLYGDEIYIRSGGRQTMLDLRLGTLPAPIVDPMSKRRSGVQIDVRYRTERRGRLEKFSVDREQQALDRFAAELAPTLIKLAQPGARHSLSEIVVASKRCSRRIIWKQAAERLPVPRLRGTMVQRVIRMQDTMQGETRTAKRQTTKEIEFQRVIGIPDEHRGQLIPRYFTLPGGRIRLAISFRIDHGGIDRKQPGTYYYLIGMSSGSTGNALSIIAPFQMNDNRSQIIDPNKGSSQGAQLKVDTFDTPFDAIQQR